MTHICKHGRSAVGLALLALLIVSGCDDRPEPQVRGPAEGGLILVTTLETPPYSCLDENTGDCAGLDIEIAREVAEKLGLPLKINRVPFADMLPAVKSGKADFAANAITITAARARDVDFSTPYASGGNVFLYRTGEMVPSIPRGRDLRIGTMTASTCQFYLSYHGVDPYCFSKCDEAVEEFRRGGIDAVFYEADTLRQEAVRSNGAFTTTPPENRENYGVAVRKDFPELLEAVNQVIAGRRAK